jgi:ribonuclease/clavin/mitogillin
MKLLRFTYRKTNIYLIKGNEDNLLAIDAGWPCTFFEYARAIKTTGFNIEQIQWVIVTHFHLDHAGLVGEMVSKGYRCAVFENQMGDIDAMEAMIAKKYTEYTKIDKTKLIQMKTRDSRQWLKGLGMDGEIVITPGHSNDSVSFISDEGDAVIGDLYAENLVMDSDIESLTSWQLLRSKGAKRILPAHGNEYRL